jgi:ATP-dependent DNA ligase
LQPAVTANPIFGRHVPTCVYCFDLLELNGRDLRELALVQRSFVSQ